ncbi:hypothetical protein GCM10007147_07310 [Nocardiopsis kunsanensis]|uniref:Uncharacterized protein n=1 Tax=Nocardiopsis kunsanensis TaxID=141693 RepID=A0A918X883_9ACTN|nr:hypothetical protein GCM10007147_07310 [Nocardiopsis kunsanensis]
MNNPKGTIVTLVTFTLDGSAQSRRHDLVLRPGPIKVGHIATDHPPESRPATHTRRVPGSGRTYHRDALAPACVTG